jgi:broad-specificity NMP kinase
MANYGKGWSPTMMNVCHQCGLYRADKIIDPSGPYAICPECGHRHPFIQVPLMVVSGASGTGKSTVCNLLTGRYQEAVLLDSDILWRSAFDQPENNHREYFETWLRVSKNIAQSGRSVVLFGAGMGVPENLESCIERRYFSSVRYLALVCSGEILSKRLRQRPAWRGAGNTKYIEEHQRFNQWFVNYNQADNQPGITRLDTSEKSLEETAKEVEAWIRENQS